MEAIVKKQIIDWAIKRNQITPAIAARKLNVKLEQFNAWGTGESYPSIPQALSLAKALKIPFGYLYLSTPPKENLPLPDLRSALGATPQAPSPDFIDVLYDAYRKQEWYKEYLKEEGLPDIPFIGKFNIANDSVSVAADIRATLGINDGTRQECTTWEDFLKRLILSAEQSRILVLRSGVVGCNTHRPLNVKEFKGFAISDKLAPLVFINEKDFKAAQIFTLAHELVHLWVGESGVSNPNYMLRSKQQNNIVEQYCDRTAAEILVPRAGFLERWDYQIALGDNLDRLARQYRVSAFVVLRRAYENDVINDDVFGAAYGELISKIKATKSGGGDFNKLVMSRNSATFTKTLLMAAGEGRVSPTEAARLLNLKYSALNGIESFIAAGESA